MDFEQELKRLADFYTDQGFAVTIRPQSKDLPPFAKDFQIELLGKRGVGGVLVAVKKNRTALAAEADLPRYAEITGGQPGWRFDLSVLEGENPRERDFRGAEEFSPDDISKSLADAEKIAHLGFVQPAVIAAWAGLEAAMRIRLRALGRPAGRGTIPREMLNELFSSGVFSREEFQQLEQLFQMRNRIVHGFSAPVSDVTAVNLLSDLARRLVEESQPVKKTA
jgi:hypothetical protein